MSRTDKDAPVWVRAEYYEPRHYLCDQTRWGRYVCNLPAEPVRAPRSVAGRRDCYWKPVWQYKQGKMPRSYRQAVYVGPLRHKVRADCRKAASEYRADGYIDVSPPTGQIGRQMRWGRD